MPPVMMLSQLPKVLKTRNKLPHCLLLRLVHQATQPYNLKRRLVKSRVVWPQKTKCQILFEQLIIILVFCTYMYSMDTIITHHIKSCSYLLTSLHNFANLFFKSMYILYNYLVTMYLLPCSEIRNSVVYVN